MRNGILLSIFAVIFLQCMCLDAMDDGCQRKALEKEKQQNGRTAFSVIADLNKKSELKKTTSVSDDLTEFEDEIFSSDFVIYMESIDHSEKLFELLKKNNCQAGYDDKGLKKLCRKILRDDEKNIEDDLKDLSTITTKKRGFLDELLKEKVDLEEKAKEALIIQKLLSSLMIEHKGEKERGDSWRKKFWGTLASHLGWPLVVAIVLCGQKGLKYVIEQYSNGTSWL